MNTELQQDMDHFKRQAQILVRQALEHGVVIAIAGGRVTAGAAGEQAPSPEIVGAAVLP